jgi:hypothetical protein
MARVWLGSQTVSPVQDSAGNRVVGAAVTIKNLDGSNATHWSAKTGGTSSTAAIVSNARGLLDRWIDPGTYTYSTSGIVNEEFQATSGASIAVFEESINLDHPDYASLVSGSNWQPAIAAAGAAAAASVGGKAGGRVYIPRRLRNFQYLPLYQDVEYFGDGQATELTQVLGTADTLAKNATAGAIARAKIRDLTLTAFDNQTANTGGLDLFRVSYGLFVGVKLSYFKNWGARAKGGPDPTTGDAMRNRFEDMWVANGQAGSCIFRASSGSDQPGAVNGGGHADGTVWTGGLGQSMPLGFVIDPPPDAGTSTYSAESLDVDMELQEVAVPFDILGGWGHRLRGRWENTSGTMLFSAGRTATGNTTSGSNVVTTVTATGSSLSFAVGMPINGTGIPADTYVIGVNLDGANTLRLGTAAGVAVNATATNTGIALTSIGTVANPTHDIELGGVVALVHGTLVTIVDPNAAIHGRRYDGSRRNYFQVREGVKFSRLGSPYDNNCLFRDSGDRLRWYDQNGGNNVVFVSRVSSTITAASYTQAGTDHVLKVDTTTNSVTINLLAANTQSGAQVQIKRISAGANTLTIDPSGAETIDGAATLSLPNQWDHATIVSDGANWLRLD